MLSSFLKMARTSTSKNVSINIPCLTANKYNIKWKHNIRRKHDTINMETPLSLMGKDKISDDIGKEINNILNKNTTEDNLTKCRLEVKGPYTKNIASARIAKVISCVEKMPLGKVKRRDEVPKEGSTFTTTVSGTLFETDEWYVQLRFRYYSEIVNNYDNKGVNSTIFKKQEITNNKSWMEIKASNKKSSDLDSSLSGKLSIKRRILIDNSLIFKMLQSWESRFYLDWVNTQNNKKHNKNLYNGYNKFNDVLIEIKEKSMDDPHNSIENCEDVINIINLLYNDNQHYIMDRLTTYTRRAVILSVSDICYQNLNFSVHSNTFGLAINEGNYLKNYTVEMTEDRNIQYHYSNKYTDLFVSGNLNPAQYILYGSKITIPHHFIEFKIPNLEKDKLLKNATELYEMMESIVDERVIKKNTGKIGFARKYVFPNVKLPM